LSNFDKTRRQISTKICSEFSNKVELTKNNFDNEGEEKEEIEPVSRYSAVRRLKNVS
jgi:hypothetical protein